MRPCPVCQKNRIQTSEFVCANCVRLYRSSCLYLASHLTDLYHVATKAASVTRQPQSSAASYAPIPIRIKAWEVYTQIIAHTEAVAAWNSIKFTANTDYNMKLIVLRNIDIFESTTYAVDMRGFMVLAKEMQTMLTPEEDKTYIGDCPRCHNGLWSTQEQETITCTKCGQESFTVDIKATTLRSLYNSTYQSTIAELVEWLKSWGIKTSKRTIQRWCTEGKIHAQNIDNRGTKLFKVGDVIKNIKMARHF